MNLILIPYGPLVDVLGEGPLNIECPATTAAELLAWLHQQYPALQAWRGRIACGLGDELLRAASPLGEAQRIALIPPVSGG